VPASAGVAVGHVVQSRPQAIVDRDGDGPHVEARRLDEALNRARVELEALRVRLEADADGGKAAIFAAHAELLDDPDLLGVARAHIEAGRSAAFAWREAVTLPADRLAQLKNELLAGRAADLRDVGRRVLRLLTGVTAEPTTYPADAILVAPDLAPSETARLDRSRVLGLCTVAGGATSHVAILARAFDIPAVTGMDPRVLDVPDGTLVVLDGSRGVVQLGPTPEDIAHVHRRQQRQAARRRAEFQAASLAARTLDGHRIEVAANAGSLADAEQAVAFGADGIGLLRSEFLFVNRATPPSEDEQTALYEAIVRTLGADRPVVIRMLDVGGDKPLSCVPIPREDNPFLGERGIRVLLGRPEVMLPHIRAILRAGRSGLVRAMLPMVATVEEFRVVKAVFEEEAVRLGVTPVPIGVAVEIPSAAILAVQLARDVDFFSIGTNDLTQYTLAMDRGHPLLAPLVDGLHPAVLHLIAMTVEGAHRFGRSVGVCGAIAGDEQAVPLLVGLGVDGLSVAPAVVPSVKALVRATDCAACRDLADRALHAATAAEVRALVPATTDD
jgi:phosphocarrier protein FPr